MLCPSSIKILAEPAAGTTLWIDDGQCPACPAGYSIDSITVGGDEDAGTSLLDMTVEANGQRYQITIGSDDALLLADSLRLYANHSKRADAKYPSRVAESVF